MMLDFWHDPPTSMFFGDPIEPCDPDWTTDPPLSQDAGPQEVTVIGWRPASDPLPPSGGGGRYEPRMPGDGGGGDNGDDDDCSCAGMTLAERNDLNVDAEVAEVLEEILARADQNMEYGSLLYVDSDGYIQHTSLIPTPDERARINVADLPILADGRTDYSRVVAMVHSHPERIDYLNRDLYVPADPDYLLFPWSGDWASFDSYANLIASAGGNAAGFEQYIIGFDGEKLVINEYDASDRGTNTVASGDPVARNQQGCTC